MSLNTFLHFTRIQTLPAALLSPLVGCLFAYYHFHSFHLLPTLLFFIGLAAINLFVSAWNNLMDYQKALDDHYKKTANILSTRQIPTSLAYRICLGLLVIDVIIGLTVTALTNLALLPLGGLCVLIAIFYTYGPFAFSRWPLGEILAGLAEGFFGFFLAVYINSWDKGYLLISKSFALTLDFSRIWPLILVGVMCFAMNFCIMLADNICDLDQDIKNGRKTLPYFITIPHALHLFASMYGLAGLAILLAIVLDILPLSCLAMVLIAPIIIRNIKRFWELQDKKQTFKLAINNLILFNATAFLTLMIGLILDL